MSQLDKGKHNSEKKRTNLPVVAALAGTLSAVVGGTAGMVASPAQGQESEAASGLAQLPNAFAERIPELQRMPVPQQIREVNLYFNAHPQKVVLERGLLILTPDAAALCQERAAAKFYALRTLDIASKIVIVQLKGTKQLHAYVRVTLEDGSVLGLDNRFPDPTTADIIAREYEPVFTVPDRYTFRINDVLAGKAHPAP